MSDKIYREDYFVFNNIIYGVGTQVLLSDECKCSYKMKHEVCVFVRGFTDGQKIFQIQNGTPQGGPIVTINIHSPDRDIRQIVYPVCIMSAQMPWHRQLLDGTTNENVHPDVFGGVVLYIVIMIVGAIFYDRWSIWIVSTIIFIRWLLNQYRV